MLKRVFDKLSNDMHADYFAFAVLEVFVFKVCVIIDISKIEFFNFSSTESILKMSSFYKDKTYQKI